MSKIIISADSTCDIGPELQKEYDIHLMNFRLELDGKEYMDSVDIMPEDLYTAWREKGILPKSCAISPLQYEEYFRELTADGSQVIHVGLGSGISSTYQNAFVTASTMEGVYTVDSGNLSGGFGLLVLCAAELVREGLSVEEILPKLEELRDHSHTSFLLDTLEFMKAGGRCSSLAAFGASLLQLKPCIEVDTKNGSKMHVGKKYRGRMEACLKSYVKDKLENRTDLDLRRVFITHSGSPESDIELVKEEVKKYANFEKIYVTRANCTISTHCGPRTLGVLFMTK